MRTSGVVVGYKIVEIVGDRVMSLFHGTNHSRVILLDTWYRCDCRWVSDTVGGKSYESGWHYFDSKKKATEFFVALHTKTDRYVVKCYVRGNIRLKWSGKCMLADEIMIRNCDIMRVSQKSKP